MLLRARLLGGIRSKAARGELRRSLPVGLLGRRGWRGALPCGMKISASRSAPCLHACRARPPVSARQAPSRSGIGARGCKTPGLPTARILIPPFPGSNPGAPASQSLFLRGFMVLTPNAREHGACARGGSVSVSQSRAGSSRFGALSLRANFGVSFLVALR
jgi:hypothetical protein